MFSFFRKNQNQGKQNPTFGDGEFYARAGDASNVRMGRSKSHAANMQVDPVLPEKKRARRRLIGAIALALAAIIVLPMILDSQPKPLENDILIQIPSKDKALFPSANHPASALAAASISTETSPEIQIAASDTLDSKEEVVTLPSPPSPAPVDNLARVEGKGDKEILENKRIKEIKKTQETSSNVLVKNATKHSLQSHTPIPTSTYTSKKSFETVNETARANAILEGKVNGKSNDKVAEHAPQKAPRFVVQVAALADQEKIAALQTKLNNAGIVSHTQKVATQTGERTRVRIGPYTNKEDAEKVRAKLEKLGLSGSVLPL